VFAFYRGTLKIFLEWGILGVWGVWTTRTRRSGAKRRIRGAAANNPTLSATPYSVDFH
jgi:hypothetical protein